MPALNNMYANHIAQAQGAFEPQRSNAAIIQFTLPQALGAGNDAERLLVLSLTSFPFPSQANNPVEIPYLNEVRKVAGIARAEAMSVTFNDYCDQATWEILLRWRHLVYNPWNGRIGLAANYKSKATISLTSPDGQSMVREMDCIGVWPSLVTGSDADLTSDEPIRITATFEIDKAYPIRTVTGGGGGGDNQGPYAGPAGSGGVI